MSASVHPPASAGAQLPAQFSDLEPFTYWAIENRGDRFTARFEHDMGQIRAFYDAILPRAHDVLTYLNTKPLEGLAIEDQRLLWMMLSLVEISRCVELWNGNDMPYYAHPKEHMRIHL